MKTQVLFRDPDELITFHKAGCFSGKNKNVYIPVLVDMVVHLYDSSGHPVLQLVQARQVYLISSSYDQMNIIGEWHTTYTYTLCYEDCATLFHASNINCLFVSSDGILISIAQSKGINVMHTTAAFDMILNN
jgi:hypothetical protein